MKPAGAGAKKRKEKHTMEMEIKADLPFGWCRNCESRELIEEKMYAGGKVYERRTICENAPICKNAEKARREASGITEKELEQKKAEKRYPACEGFRGCAECLDPNRGYWPCCPATILEPV